MTKPLEVWSNLLEEVKGNPTDSKFERNLKRKLNELVLEDQVARSTVMHIQTTGDLDEMEKYWAMGRSVAAFYDIDAVSTNYLAKTLKKIVWVDENTFGKKASKQAWLIAQHADRSPEFQKQVLDRMKNYLGSSSIANNDYAYLYDRVSLKLGKTQLYGTQFLDKCDNGVKVLRPVENSSELDLRRKALGMTPISEYLKSISSGC